MGGMADKPSVKNAGRVENLTNAGKGRAKGVPNKNTSLLKDAILAAATKAGGKEGLEGYLVKQAKENPVSFNVLLGKVLPMQLASDPDNPFTGFTINLVKSGNSSD